MSRYTITPKILNVSKIFQHGKTQVPRDVRKFLGVEDGDKIIWYNDNGKITVVKPE